MPATPQAPTPAPSPNKSGSKNAAPKATSAPTTNPTATPPAPQQMMQDDAPSKLPLIITIVLFVLALAAAGVFGYFYMNAKKNAQMAQRQLQGIEASRSHLEKQLEEKEEQLNMLKEKKEETENQMVVDSVAIAYIPAGQFETAAQSELQTKVLAPFIDYTNISTPLASVSIEFSQDEQYLYTISAVAKSGGHIGMLVGNTEAGESAESLNWYIPDCLNACQIPAWFAERYPELVAALPDKEILEEETSAGVQTVQ